MRSDKGGRIRNVTTVFETLSVIINLQSKVIDELFLLLLQHISAEELDAMPVTKKINEAAKLKADLEKEGEL